jgi:hypothetical protein
MRSAFSARALLALAACIGCTTAWAQDTANPVNSLGDLARQTRAEHASADNKPSKAQELVDEMQQEQEAADNAPVGYKNYNAGEYRVFVPYPFSLEGRENGGAVLLGSRIGLSNTEVMVGNPIPVPPNLNDTSLLNVVRQLASMQGAQAYCNAMPQASIPQSSMTQGSMTQGSHKTYRCSWQTSPRLLGHEVWGSEEFILISNSVSNAVTNRLIPVMCVSPDDPHQMCVVYDTWGHNTCSDREHQLYGWDHSKAQAAADARYRDERTTAQVCDQVIYPSIQLKEDIVVHPVTIAEGKLLKPVSAVAQDTSVVAGPQGSSSAGSSLADLARQTRQAPHGKAQATLDYAEGRTAPTGFQAFAMQYCPNPQQCSDASVVVPEKAEVVSRVNGQYIFKIMLNGDPVMLYAGPADVNAPYRSMTDPDYIRMRDLANANGWSREKPDSVSTQEMTIEGKPALMTRFRYQRDQKKWWIGERTLVEMRGGQFLVGCAAREERFAEAEALCTTLVNSLRLQ